MFPYYLLYHIERKRETWMALLCNEVRDIPQHEPTIRNNIQATSILYIIICKILMFYKLNIGQYIQQCLVVPIVFMSRLLKEVCIFAVHRNFVIAQVKYSLSFILKLLFVTEF